MFNWVLHRRRNKESFALYADAGEIALSIHEAVMGVQGIISILKPIV